MAKPWDTNDMNELNDLNFAPTNLHPNIVQLHDKIHNPLKNIVMPPEMTPASINLESPLKPISYGWIDLCTIKNVILHMLNHINAMHSVHSTSLSLSSIQPSTVKLLFLFLHKDIVL